MSRQNQGPSLWWWHTHDTPVIREISQNKGLDLAVIMKMFATHGHWNSRSLQLLFAMDPKHNTIIRFQRVLPHTYRVPTEQLENEDALFGIIYGSFLVSFKTCKRKKSNNPHDFAFAYLKRIADPGHMVITLLKEPNFCCMGLRWKITAYSFPVAFFLLQERFRIAIFECWVWFWN